MKKLMFGTFVLSALLLFSFNAQAQVRTGKYNKLPNKKVVVVKKGHNPVHVNKGHPTRYQRNQVVVVKKHNPRVMNVLPNGYTTCVHQKNNYYYHSGCYYRQYNNTYHVVAPPRGIRIQILPVGYRRIVMYGRPHIFYMGIYYKQVGNEYETVEPEVGTIVPEISDEMAEEVTIDDVKYYEVADVLYKPVETDEGTQYEVAGELDDETNE
jgi:hypothetical protein